MNCDTVFDHLTRGPFPAGAESDALVEMHLAGCHECRLLAEALRPAVDLFHETLRGEESDGLPYYQGRLVPAASHDSLQACVEQACQEPRDRLEGEPMDVDEFDAPAMPLSAWRLRDLRRSETPSQRWWQIGLCALAAAGCLMMAGVWGRESGDKPAGATVRTAPLLGAAETPVLFAGARLAPACWKDSAPDESHRHGSLLCCARCHNASKPGVLSVENLALVHHACQSCHWLE